MCGKRIQPGAARWGRSLPPRGPDIQLQGASTELVGLGLPPPDLGHLALHSHPPHSFRRGQKWSPAPKGHPPRGCSPRKLASWPRRCLQAPPWRLHQREQSPWGRRRWALKARSADTPGPEVPPPAPARGSGGHWPACLSESNASQPEPTDAGGSLAAKCRRPIRLWMLQAAHQWGGGVPAPRVLCRSLPSAQGPPEDSITLTLHECGLPALAGRPV